MARNDDADDHVARADVELTELPHAAGGLGALWATARHLRRDSGLVRGTKALLAMNQPTGFDCPGCAWPVHYWLRAGVGAIRVAKGAAPMKKERITRFPR